MTPFTLRDFVVESNRIEGITVMGAHDLMAHEAFLSNRPVNIALLQWFVDYVAAAPLRASEGMDVVVGNHRPILGGPAVRIGLQDLLNRVSVLTPYEVHQEYETLHPFMDGNGRSGRALWLHIMGGIEKAPLGFLHHWYYQSLNAGRT